VSSHCVQMASRFGVATRTAVAALAGEREQVFVCTVVAADAGEAVVEDAAGEALVGDLCDHGAPWAVLAREALVVDCLQALQMIRHQPKQRRRLGPSGLVDAARRRGCVGHARSGTGERRAYARLGGGPSSFRCVTGRFDATSVWRRLYDPMISVFTMALLRGRSIASISLAFGESYDPNNPASLLALLT
jgi:hypothetical protein